MIGLTVLELVVSTTAFWSATGEVHRASLRVGSNAADDGKQTSIQAVLRSPIAWMIAVFLLGYTGAEVSLGGWIVEFMLVVRHADPFLAGLASSFFWAGLTLGRVFLGLITGRIGEKLAITIYIITGIFAQIVYWLVPNVGVSMAVVTLLGLTMGPLYPTAIVALAKLLPSQYHVSAISFAAALGQAGAAVFPFMVGATAEGNGVQVLQPIILAIFVFILITWALLPGSLRKGGLEQARENNETVGSGLIKWVRWVKGKGRARNEGEA